MFYLKSINADILMMIQSVDGTTLPDAYNITVKVENNLINARKLPPWPTMPVFPKILVLTQEITSTSAPAPPQSMYTYMGAPHNVASTSSSSKDEMNDVKEFL